MQAYRLLTGTDDAAFCHKITAALNAGWTLHGGPTISFNPESGDPICAQAVIKEVPDQDYAPEIKLSTL